METQPALSTAHTVGLDAVSEQFNHTTDAVAQTANILIRHGESLKNIELFLKDQYAINKLVFKRINDLQKELNIWFYTSIAYFIISFCAILILFTVFRLK